MAVDTAAGVAASDVAADPAAGMDIDTANAPADSARGAVAVEPGGGAGAAPQAGNKKKRKKRNSGGPQAKLRVKRSRNERQSNPHLLAAAGASQDASDGEGADGDL